MRKKPSLNNAQSDDAVGDVRQLGHNWDKAQEPVAGLAREALRRLAGRDWDTQPGASATPQALRAFVDAILAGDATKGMELIQKQRTDGRSYQQIAEALFAEAARHIGASWSADRLSLIDVTVGTSTLLRINSMTRRAFGHPAVTSGNRIVFASLPKQGHTLGLILATEAFRQKGMEVELLLACDPDEIVREVRACGSRLVGLTAGNHDRLTDILALATRLKDCTDPPSIMVGGTAASEWYDYVGEGLVDCIVESIDQALYFAEGLDLD
ncbi:B12-binding domain-containing protein [Silicimonas sp. MF1-12-2]|uniref:cobalamin B12-binding domain-containing protein n=1 Tax=Silicimonas sp. MF1-12-2 TaxID=3384793 RepID=UPI0039B51522